MKNSHLSSRAWSAALGGALRLADGGQIRIYSGPQRSEIGADNKLLVALKLDAQAFRTDGKTATANSLEPGTARASGQATFFQLVTKDGHWLVDGTCGTIDDEADLVINDADIKEGGRVSILGWTLTAAE